MASPTGQQSCCLCFLEVWQTTQMGSWSGTQGHISPGSQYSSPAGSSDPSPSWMVRLGTGSSRLWLRHRGQSRRGGPWVQYRCRQVEQKLWLHFRTTGSRKIPQHMEQERSISWEGLQENTCADTGFTWTSPALRMGCQPV
ncbi:hypothetical protein EYF80_020985 [Liparis tanakae]|uniref:Uncharacterized protein n=1 Tax=Liparis tanakae TaxID=230148 RepID=A0A4Z2HSW0_9TELE|nr:hypothetical protein EYF80_020985 [Liparis tanakae]